MNRRLDEQERLVIPKEIRKQLGLTKGSEVNIELRGNEIVITNPAKNDLQERVDKAKQFYIHELLKREQLGVPTKMPYEAVEMFNIIEGNKD